MATDNNTTSIPPEECYLPYSEEETELAMRIILFIMSLVLTLEAFLTIHINLTTDKIREKESTKLVTNLAISGALLGILISLFSLAKFFHASQKSEEMRARFLVLAVIPRYLHIVTVLCLCCLTLDRYVAICWPLRYYKILTRRKCRLLTISSWVVPLIVFGATLFKSDLNTSCPNPHPFVITYFVLFTVATVSVVFMYVLVAREFRGQVSEVTEEMKDDTRRVRRKTTFDVIFIVLLNLVFSFPSMGVCLTYLRQRQHSPTWPHLLLLTHQLLFYPVYAWRNADFRAALLARCAAATRRCCCGG